MESLSPTSGKDQGNGAKLENSRLLTAMHEVALDDTPEKRKTLYTELLKARFIFPTPELNVGPGAHVSDGKMTVQVVGITDAKGNKVTVVFTDYEALRNWDPNTASVEVGAKDYFNMVVPLGAFQEIVINPFDPRRKMIRPGGHITRREFELLAQGTLPESQPTLQVINAPTGTKVRFKKIDSSFSDDVESQIRQTLTHFEEVESAFLLMVAYGQDKPQRAIAICFSGTAPEQRQRLVAKSVFGIIRPMLEEKEPFDLIPVNSGSRVYQAVLRTVPPFYERETA